jgi:hypothetical protein
VRSVRRSASRAFVTAAVSAALVASGLVGLDLTSSPVAHAASKTGDVTSLPDVVSAQLAAARLGHRVEISGQDTATDTTYANPDGTFSTDFGTAPVRVKQPDGSWKATDLTLVKQTDGSWGPSAGPHPVSFSPGGDTNAGTLTTPDGSKVSLGWLSKLPAPSVSGGVATYQLDATTQLQLAMTGSGFNAHVILTAPPVTGPVFRLPLSLGKLAASQAADGSIDFNDAGGHQLARMAPLQMWDAQRDAGGDPSNVTNVPATLTAVGGKSELDLSPALGWLTSPSTVYPVTIDPNVTVTDNSGACQVFCV